MPQLNGTGYSTPGGKVQLELTQALGGAPGLMQIGTGKANHPFLAVEKVMAEFLVMLTGPKGAPGAGSFTAPGTVVKLGTAPSQLSGEVTPLPFISRKSDRQ